MNLSIGVENTKEALTARFLYIWGKKKRINIRRKTEVNKCAIATLLSGVRA